MLHTVKVFSERVNSAIVQAHTEFKKIQYRLIPKSFTNTKGGGMPTDDGETPIDSLGHFVEPPVISVGKRLQYLPVWILLSIKS
jgi:hypothetical protein